VISKFNGTCFYCKQPTKAGTDTYELDTKRSYHEACKEAAWSTPDAEQRALAERLGFCAIADIPRMAERWVLWDLHKTDRGAAARREESAAYRGSNTTLF